MNFVVKPNNLMGTIMGVSIFEAETGRLIGALALSGSLSSQERSAICSRLSELIERPNERVAS
jgi:hypothetical protein